MATESPHPRKKVTHVTQERGHTRVYTGQDRPWREECRLLPKAAVQQRSGTHVKTVTACTLATWPAVKKITSSPLCRGELREQRAELGWRRLQLWGQNLPPFSFASKIKRAPTMID